MDKWRFDAPVAISREDIAERIAEHVAGLIFDGRCFGRGATELINFYESHGATVSDVAAVGPDQWSYTVTDADFAPHITAHGRALTHA